MKDVLILHDEKISPRSVFLKRYFIGVETAGAYVSSEYEEYKECACIFSGLCQREDHQAIFPAI